MIPVGLIVWIVIMAFCGLVALIPIVFRLFCSLIIAPLCTPKGHRRYGDYKESEGYDALRRENYGVTPILSSDAMKKT